MAYFHWIPPPPLQCWSHVQRLHYPHICCIFIWFIYCFVCRFGKVSFARTLPAKLCVFFFVIFVSVSDLATKSSSSETTTWSLALLWICGRPCGAGPLPGTLKVLRARAGGLTLMWPPCLVLLVATVPLHAWCTMHDIWDTINMR